MRRSSSSSTPVSSFTSAFVQALRHVGVVALIGMALATVFTAWTPGSFLPEEVVAQIASAFDVHRIGSVSTPAPPTPTAPPAAAPRIGIVAGHSGPQNDPGAVCPDGLTEASVNMDIATRVKAGLEANGFQVDLLTEFDDRLVGYKALAVVSIHNDSCDYINDLATGFKAARAIDSGVPEKADRLVACLIDRYPKQTGLPFHKNSITPDMTQYHSYHELGKGTPAAIIETGFLNLDRRILTEEPYRVAQGVIDGILCYALNQPVSFTPSP
jgi:N-acetylmuramoyl-L-alanine amidase